MKRAWQRQILSWIVDGLEDFMSRFYVRLSLFLLPMFALLMMAMSALGSTQPIHPALRGFVEGCEGIPQPCWYGIAPNLTSPAEAEHILMAHGFSFVETEQWAYWQSDIWCRVSMGASDEFVLGIHLTLCQSVSLENVFSIILDSPTHVGRNCDNGYYLYMGLKVIHSNGTTPDSLVMSIELNSFPLGSALLNAPHAHWRGFWHRYPITGGAGCG